MAEVPGGPGARGDPSPYLPATLQRALSPKGNLTLKTLLTILKRNVGLRPLANPAYEDPPLY
jgi:hypothetical protein